MSQDILEEAKEALSYYPPDDPEFPVGLVKRLISEVERLRSYMNKPHRVANYYKEQIESLTKERDVSQTWGNALQINYEKLEAENAELQKERDAWKGYVHRMEMLSGGEILALNGKLEAENAKLKDEMAFIDSEYVNEEDSKLTWDAQALKYKALTKKLEAERDERKGGNRDSESKGIQGDDQQDFRS